MAIATCTSTSEKRQAEVLKICILSLVMAERGSELQYNTQDVGLGRAFAELGHDVRVIHFEPFSSEVSEEKIDTGVTLQRVKSRHIGNNSIGIRHHLPTDVDMMICFSDIQLSFVEVYRHCKAHGIKLYPYVGVIESHSRRRLVRAFMHVVKNVNLWLYKQLPVIAKTTAVAKDLADTGIDDVKVLPIGLDTTAFSNNIANDRHSLRQACFEGIDDEAAIVLFVGKLTQKKRPLEAIDIFARYSEQHSDSRMIIIGQGETYGELMQSIDERGLTSKIKVISNIANSDMGKYYTAADVLLNCNHVEIFGMCILEAMYHSCPVVAFAASGPKMIITHKVDGYLYETADEAVNLIAEAIKRGRLEEARDTVTRQFTWTCPAQSIIAHYHSNDWQQI